MAAGRRVKGIVARSRTGAKCWNWPKIRQRATKRVVALYGKADVAKSVDATDFNWSAHGEIRGAEPLKVGER